MHYDDIRQKMRNWRLTQDYALQYVAFSSAAEALLKTADRLMSSAENIRNNEASFTAYTQIASGCKNIHRGFYCPSQIQDLVGGVRRGKRISRLTSKSHTYYLYGFDSEDRLIWSKEYFNSNPVYTELLIYEDSKVYGLTFQSDNTLSIVTEETYENGKLIRYKKLFLTDAVQSNVIDMTQEEYTYKDDTLVFCDEYILSPAIMLLTHDRTTSVSNKDNKQQYYVEKLIGLSDFEVLTRSGLYDV